MNQNYSNEHQDSIGNDSVEHEKTTIQTPAETTFQNDPEQMSYGFDSMPSSSYTVRNTNGSGFGSKLLFVGLAVILCVTLSFGAGFAGARYAYQLQLNDSDINEAPGTDEIYHNDPADLLSKDPSSESIYGSAGEDVFSVSQVVKQVEDSVVVIDAEVVVGSSGLGIQTSTSSGSGVVISANGYILTCHHVVDDAKNITVTLNSGEKYEAVLVGSDENTDLAVIRIDPKEKLTFAEQGCSADLIAGEHVVAIGNPLGTLGGSVTDGIISATERRVQTSDGTVMTLLQTNAAINSGNSGGGLFNLDGKLIGIVNAKYAAAGVEGLAFAIPIDLAYPVEEELIQYGYVRGVPDHGLELLDVTRQELNYYYFYHKIDTIGVYIVSSEYEVESEVTDVLKNKDRIVSINGTAINTTEEFKAIIGEYQVGDKVTLVIERATDGQTAKEMITVTLTLREYVPDYIKNNNS